MFGMFIVVVLVIVNEVVDGYVLQVWFVGFFVFGEYVNVMLGFIFEFVIFEVVNVMVVIWLSDVGEIFFKLWWVWIQEIVCFFSGDVFVIKIQV